MGQAVEQWALERHASFCQVQKQSKALNKESSKHRPGFLSPGAGDQGREISPHLLLFTDLASPGARLRPRWQRKGRSWALKRTCDCQLWGGASEGWGESFLHPNTQNVGHFRE